MSDMPESYRKEVAEMVQSGVELLNEIYEEDIRRLVDKRIVEFFNLCGYSRLDHETQMYTISIAKDSYEIFLNYVQQASPKESEVSEDNTGG